MSSPHLSGVTDWFSVGDDIVIVVPLTDAGGAVVDVNRITSPEFGIENVVTGAKTAGIASLLDAPTAAYECLVPRLFTASLAAGRYLAQFRGLLDGRLRTFRKVTIDLGPSAV